MGRFVFLIIGFAVFVALVAPSDNKLETSSAVPDRVSIVEGPEQSSTAPMPTQQQVSFGEIRLERGEGGQFHVDTRVNGQSVPFLVDTGADMVALTIDDARRLGLNINPYEFIPVGTGAGGALKGQPVMLSRIEIGGRTLSDVQAVVIDGLETNLLGQSVLREFGKVELSGDTMVIRT